MLRKEHYVQLRWTERALVFLQRRDLDDAMIQVSEFLSNSNTECNTELEVKHADF